MTEIVGASGAVRAAGPTAPEKDVIYQYAKQQLAWAREQKDLAVEKMDFLNAEQKEQELAFRYLEGFRAKYHEAVDKNQMVTMTAAEVQWCYDRGITLPWNPGVVDTNYGIADWNTVVKNTERYVEGLGADTQALMVLVQDSLGQYNAFTQGASANIHSSAELLSTVAKW